MIPLLLENFECKQIFNGIQEFRSFTWDKWEIKSEYMLLIYNAIDVGRNMGQRNKKWHSENSKLFIQSTITSIVKQKMHVNSKFIKRNIEKWEKNDKLTYLWYGSIGVLGKGEKIV